MGGVHDCEYILSVLWQKVLLRIESIGEGQLWDQLRVELDMMRMYQQKEYLVWENDVHKLPYCLSLHKIL